MTKKRPSVTAKLCFQAILEESGQNGRRTVPPVLFLAPNILPFSKQFECGVSKETSFVFSRQFIIPERPSASVKCHSMLDLQSVFFSLFSHEICCVHERSHNPIWYWSSRGFLVNLVPIRLQNGVALLENEETRGTRLASWSHVEVFQEELNFSWWT